MKNVIFILAMMFSNSALASPQPIPSGKLDLFKKAVVSDIYKANFNCAGDTMMSPQSVISSAQSGTVDQVAVSSAGTDPVLTFTYADSDTTKYVVWLFTAYGDSTKLTVAQTVHYVGRVDLIDPTNIVYSVDHNNKCVDQTGAIAIDLNRPCLGFIDVNGGCWQ